MTTGRRKPRKIIVVAACALALGAPVAGAPGGPQEGFPPRPGPFAGALPAPRLSEETTSPTEAGDSGVETTPAFPAGLVEGGSAGPRVPADRSLARAAGQVALLELLPWSFSRYVSKAESAFISTNSLRENLRTGFTYDRDNFGTDQFSHPFHGSLFYGAARSNGFSFWESGAFAFFGSFAWEVGMESEPPAFNDLVNTTLGGMDRGEIAHRLGTLLRDNAARGGTRFWREFGAAVLDPMGAFNRLLRRELVRPHENPADRFPSRFVVDVEGFWRSASSGLAGEEGEDQGGVGVRLRYGDPFDSERPAPYEWFELALDAASPSSSTISSVQSRGVLAARTLGEAAGTRQRLALMLRYVYYDDGPVSFGGQSFDLSHLALVPLGGGLELRTEAGIAAFLVGAVAVDYEDVSSVVFGRGFDFGPVGALQASARLRRREIDLLEVGGSVLWQSTLDGVSRGSRIASLNAEGRLPLFRERLSAGAGWGWTERTTTYDAFPTVRKSGCAVRLFAAVTFR